MNSWMIYLWTRLDIIVILFGILSAVFLFVLSLLCMAYCGCDKNNDKDTIKFLKKIIPKFFLSFIVFLCLAILLPMKKDAAMIYIIPKMAQSETFNAISKETPEITKLALEALKETLQGMTKKE